MNIVQKAKGLSYQIKEKGKTTKDEKELALALLKSEVSLKGAAIALGKKWGSGIYVRSFIALRSLYKEGRLKIV